MPDTTKETPQQTAQRLLDLIEKSERNDTVAALDYEYFTRHHPRLVAALCRVVLGKAAR